MTGQPIEVYVELAGKEKYHQSLKGRDEANQHPISAITNLEENLDTINERIDTTNENITELAETTNDKITNIESQIEETKTEVKDYTDEKVQELNDEITGKLDHLDNYYTKDETDEFLEGAFHYKGQVPDFESLPLYQNQKGDVWNVQKNGANYVWTGFAWDNLSPVLCLKGYAKKEYVDGTIETGIRLLKNFIQETYYDKQEIDDKLDEIIHFDPETAFVFKGAVTTVSRLPMNDNKVGDVYVVLEDNSKWFWVGASWELLAQDLTNKIYTKDEINTLLELKANIEDVYTKDEIENIYNRVEHELDDLRDHQENLDSIVGGLNTTVTNVVKQVGTLTNNVGTLTTNVGEITERLTTLEEVVEDITEQSVTREEFTELQDNVTNNTEQIEDINKTRTWHEIG